MKKGQWFALAGIGLLSAGVLAACGNNAASQSKVYSYVYVTDPDTLDYTINQRSSTGNIATQVVDGLLENDKYGNLQPALAKDWTVSKDGLTYTFKLRDDAKWFTSEGEEYADVKAQDFVTGLKHAADKNSEALYLLNNSIVGLQDYVDGKTKDFSTVGIKAVDDHTLQYTLTQPENFFTSKLTMGVTWPINEDFLKSKGDDFGKADDMSSILSNGPFLLSSMTSKSSIEFKKNPGYYDADKVKIDGVKLAYYDGSDQDSLGRGFAEGAYSITRLFPNSTNYAKVEKEFKDNIYYTDPGVDTQYAYFNVNRQSYNFTNKKTDKEKEDSKKAMRNKDFRQAIAFGLNRTAYNAQTQGEKGADVVTRNTFVPSDFVQANGKDFGQMTAEQLATFGDQWKDMNLADGQEGIHNVEKAKAAFAKAKEALQAEGVTFPVHLDMPAISTSPSTIQRAGSFKQSVEDALGKDNVVLDVVQISDNDNTNSNYMAETTAQRDYDIQGMAWSPDYQDPSTYLDIFSPVKGSSVDQFGLDVSKDGALIEQLGLNEYKALVDDATRETDQTARFEKYAKAQAWLMDSGFVININAFSGGSPQLSRIVPFVRAFSQIGSKGSDSYKYIELQEKPVTTKEYEEGHKKWLEEKKASNEAYEKDLAKHVK